MVGRIIAKTVTVPQAIALEILAFLVLFGKELEKWYRNPALDFPLKILYDMVNLEFPASSLYFSFILQLTKKFHIINSVMEFLTNAITAPQAAPSVPLVRSYL